MRYFIILMALLSSVAFAQTETTQEDIIYTDSTTNSTVETRSNTTTTLKSPPASAISPTINTSNSDLCTFGVAGAVQTQILGISTGTQVTDENCERLKNAKVMYDMGMKVAAVSIMCQDPRVFEAMLHAGTPCPYDGKIGVDAKANWELHGRGLNVTEQIDREEDEISDEDKTLIAGGGIGALLLILLL